MTTTESGISHLPENIQSALVREPVVLSTESVGRYFRNEGEIADVEELIAQLREGTIAVGLVGSRLRGKFSYPSNELFNRFCYIFPGFVYDLLTEEEQDAWGRSDSIPIPERLQQPFDEITAFLNSAQANHTNLDDIDFSKLPLSLQDLIKFSNFDRGLSPGDIVAMTQKELYTRVFLRAGNYFPDIDIAVISENPLEGNVAWVGDTIGGSRSGVLISPTLIHPFAKKRPWPGDQEAIDSMIENFRPLSKPV